MILKQCLFALAVVSCSTGATLAQTPARPGNPLATSLASHDSETVVTADERGKSISVIDTKTGQVITMPVNITPHNIQVSGDGRKLFAVGAVAAAAHDMKQAMDEPGRLIVVRARSVAGGSTADIKVGRNPAHVILNALGTRAFVTNGGDNTVSVINLARSKTVKTIAVGASPHGLRMSPDGLSIYIANTADGSVSVVNTRSLTEVKRITVGKGPVQVAFTPDGRQVYVSLRDEDSTAVIDAAMRKVIATIKVGPAPIQLYALPNGREVYVANQGNEAAPGNTVSIIDVQSQKVVADVVTGAGAHGVVISKDGSHAFITNTFADTVSEIDTSTRQVTRSFPVGPGPGGITFIPAVADSTKF